MSPTEEYRKEEPAFIRTAARPAGAGRDTYPRRVRISRKWEGDDRGPGGERQRGAQTFTVRVNDRKAYEFKPAPEHKVDLAHVKET
jgi:hypothetical protein